MDSTNDADGAEDTCLIEYTVDPTEPATHAVLEAVAEVSDSGVEELPALYESIETDALDQLVAPRITETPRSEVTVQFTYCEKFVNVKGRTVEVHSSEE